MDKLKTCDPPLTLSSKENNINPTCIDVNSSLPKYTSSIKCSKKSNITRDNIGEIMLAQIPGVSMSAAQSLMEKYKTIKNLIDILEKNENCLDDFKLECKNGFRKINKTTIIALKEFLMQV